MSDKRLLITESVAFHDFVEWCKAERTQERCGLFVLKDQIISFVPCENVAYDKKNSFLIHPADFARCSDDGDVIAVGHSHVTAPAEPSGEDKTNSENCHLPFLIYQPESDEHCWYEPTGEIPPLIGRTWTLGVSDCYTIVRDYYALHGVELRDYVRNDASCLRNVSLFMQHYAENDFVDVTGQLPKTHDVALISIMADVPNHAAVFVSDDVILHHIQGRLSCHDPYGGYWRRHTVKLMRHKKWL